MTVLTKASDMGRKPDILNSPLVVDTRYDPERPDPRGRPRTHHVWVYRSQCNVLMLCFTLFLAAVLMIAAIVGLVYYTADLGPATPRYKGYCAIPIEVPRDILLQNARAQKQQQLQQVARMPLRWSVEPDVTVFSTVDEQASDETLNNLLERFDIDDNVEKISVYNSGNNVEFIHDFNANSTGIVDKNRCFMMELDPDVVMSPGMFVFSIQRGDAFDVMRVRSQLHALVPPAPDLLASVGAVYAERCQDKPTYKLEKRNVDIIRKRSVERPPHHYLHFAGKHLQEISIDNLQDLLAYEKKLAA